MAEVKVQNIAQNNIVGEAANSEELPLKSETVEESPKVTESTLGCPIASDPAVEEKSETAQITPASAASKEDDVPEHEMVVIDLNSGQRRLVIRKEDLALIEETIARLRLSEDKDREVVVQHNQSRTGTIPKGSVVTPTPAGQQAAAIVDNKKTEESAGIKMENESKEQQSTVIIKGACAKDCPIVPTNLTLPPINNPHPMTVPAVRQPIQEYQRLLNFENMNGFIWNRNPFDCSICLNKCGKGRGVVIRDCLHTFCKICLKSAIEHCEEAEVKCPEFQCEAFLQHQEIRRLVPKRTFDKHLSISIRMAEQKTRNSFHCKTPNCNAWWIVEDDEADEAGYSDYEEGLNVFLCFSCKRTNCMDCKAIHYPLTCSQHRQRNNNRQTVEVVDQMVRQRQAMRCPKCEIVLQKIEGCDLVTCTVCQMEICWATRGPRWGPRGKGDTSRGCRCGINGVKCSPDCNFCH